MAYNEPGPSGLKLALRKKNLRGLDLINPDFADVTNTGTRPTPANTPGKATMTSTSVEPSRKGLLSTLSKGADAITPYLSNAANALRRAPRPRMGKMVSSVSTTAPSLEAERNEIDRSIRGVDRSADLNLDANTAAAVKAGNLIQGLRAKGQSWANQAQLGVQAQNQTNSLNANIEAINSSKVDQYQNQQLEANIANQRTQSANLANAADKRIGQIANRDAMNLDKQKFGILSQVYGSGVLDRLVKKVANGNTDKALGLDNFANGGKLKKRLRKVTSTPPEMAGQYMANGGGLSRDKNYGSKSNPYPSVDSSDFAGGGRSYPIPTQADAVDALRLAGLHGRADVKARVYSKYPGLRKAFGGPVDGGGTFKTQAELDAANALADGISRRRGLLPGHVGTKIGDTKPTWDIDPSLIGSKVKTLPFNVPNYVQRSDIQTNNGSAWYTDPQSGDVVDIDLSVLNQPRFKMSDEQKALDLAKRSTALTHRSGGYINGTIRRMAKGKLRKIY